MDSLEFRTLLCNAAVKGYHDRLFAGTSGNLSICDRENGRVFITPSGYAYDQMTPSDIVVIDFSGNVLEGAHKPSSEWPMHLALYRENKKFGAVVHTHSPYATAFAVLNRPIPVVLIEMLFFLHGDVKVSPYAPPGSEALGIAAAPFLHSRTACLLKNHGVVAVGKDIDEAYLRAVYVEDAASICHKAMAIGQIEEIPMEEQNRIRREKGLSIE